MTKQAQEYEVPQVHGDWIHVAKNNPKNNWAEIDAILQEYLDKRKDQLIPGVTY